MSKIQKEINRDTDTSIRHAKVYVEGNDNIYTLYFGVYVCTVITKVYS